MKLKIMIAVVLSVMVFPAFSFGQRWLEPVDSAEFYKALENAEALNVGRPIQYRKLVQEDTDTSRSSKSTETIKLYLSAERMWFYEKIIEGGNLTEFEELLYDDRVYTRINERDWLAGNQLSRFEDITVYSAGKSDTRPNCSQMMIGQHITGNYLATVFKKTSFSNRGNVLDQTERTVWFSYEGYILRDETKTKQFGDYKFHKTTLIEYKYDKLDKIHRPL